MGSEPPDEWAQDVTLLPVIASRRAADIVQVHEEAAAVAYSHIFSEAFPRPEVLARWTAHAGPVILAVGGARVLGFAASTPDGMLEGLYVLPVEAGRGIGTALLEAIGPVDRLWVLEQNHSGRAFYERRGWRWSGSERAADDAGGQSELLYVR